MTISKICQTIGFIMIGVALFMLFFNITWIAGVNYKPFDADNFFRSLGYSFVLTILGIGILCIKIFFFPVVDREDDSPISSWFLIKIAGIMFFTQSIVQIVLYFLLN